MRTSRSEGGSEGREECQDVDMLRLERGREMRRRKGGKENDTGQRKWGNWWKEEQEVGKDEKRERARRCGIQEGHVGGATR